MGAPAGNLSGNEIYKIPPCSFGYTSLKTAQVFLPELFARRQYFPATCGQMQRGLQHNQYSKVTNKTFIAATALPMNLCFVFAYEDQRCLNHLLTLSFSLQTPAIWFMTPISFGYLFPSNKIARIKDSTQNAESYQHFTRPRSQDGNWLDACSWAGISSTWRDPAQDRLDQHWERPRRSNAEEL